MNLMAEPQRLFTRLRDRLTTRSDDETTSITSERIPIVRKMGFDFAGSEPPIPRHWLGGSVLGTNIANGLNLVFPAGERFFVRTVNHYIKEIDDPELHDRVRRFFGQEGQHAKEHERFFEILRAQGIDIDSFLRAYQRLGYELLEPKVPMKMRLSITVALEHFTAVFAEHAFRHDVIRERAPAVIRELLLWHAAEEIEHKDVAFDVLARVDDSYALRIAGLLAATALLLGFWSFAAVSLLRQEPELDWPRLARELAISVQQKQLGGHKMGKAFISYLAPDFHPSKMANDHLAREYLEGIGRSQA